MWGKMGEEIIINQCLIYFVPLKLNRESGKHVKKLLCSH
jgi:hypothetical protein